MTSTGNATCSFHRPPNSSVSPIVSPVSTGAIVTATAIDALRSAIRTEIARWAQHASYGTTDNTSYFTTIGTAITSGSIIDETPTVNAKDDAMQAVSVIANTTIPNTSPYPAGATLPPGPDMASTVPTTGLTNYTFNVGNAMTAANYQSLLDSYNNLRNDCICNADCGCNAVCACDGDCGCNYSDMRLKMEICYC